MNWLSVSINNTLFTGQNQYIWIVTNLFRHNDSHLGSGFKDSFSFRNRPCVYIDNQGWLLLPQVGTLVVHPF